MCGYRENLAKILLQLSRMLGYIWSSPSISLAVSLSWVRDSFASSLRLKFLLDSSALCLFLDCLASLRYRIFDLIAKLSVLAQTARLRILDFTVLCLWLHCSGPFSWLLGFSLVPHLRLYCTASFSWLTNVLSPCHPHFRSHGLFRAQQFVWSSRQIRQGKIFQTVWRRPKMLKIRISPLPTVTHNTQTHTHTSIYI